VLNMDLIFVLQEFFSPTKWIKDLSMLIILITYISQKLIVVLMQIKIFVMY